jgi:methionine-rich copper-binding protein CopC
MKKLSRWMALGAAVALTVTGPALAHTRLVQSNPAADSTVQTGPKTNTLTFNERLVPTISSFELTMPEHRMKVPVQTAVSRDGKQIVGTLKNPLTAGSYKIVWTAAGSDGHKMTGEVAFKVG